MQRPFRMLACTISLISHLEYFLSLRKRMKIRPNWSPTINITTLFASLQRKWVSIIHSNQYIRAWSSWRDFGRVLKVQRGCRLRCKLLGYLMRKRWFSVDSKSWMVPSENKTLCSLTFKNGIKNIIFYFSLHIVLCLGGGIQYIIIKSVNPQKS